MQRTASAGGLSLFLLALLLGSGQAQTSAPIKGMASTVGLYVYPKAQQSTTQQLTDESQCYSNAKTQTGFDPNATTTAAQLNRCIMVSLRREVAGYSPKCPRTPAERMTSWLV